MAMIGTATMSQGKGPGSGEVYSIRQHAADRAGVLGCLVRASASGPSGGGQAGSGRHRAGCQGHPMHVHTIECGGGKSKRKAQLFGAGGGRVRLR